MNISYELTINDNIAFLIHTLFAGDKEQKQINNFKLLCSIISFFSGIALALFNREYLLIGACLFCSILLYLLLPKKLISNYLKSRLRNRFIKDKAICKDYPIQVSIDISENGIQTHTKGEDCSYSWICFSSLVVTPEHYFFYKSSTSALIIPRSAFLKYPNSESLENEIMQIAEKAANNNQERGSNRSLNSDKTASSS